MPLPGLLGDVVLDGRKRVEAPLLVRLGAGLPDDLFAPFDSAGRDDTSIPQTPRFTELPYTPPQHDPDLAPDLRNVLARITSDVATVTPLKVEDGSTHNTTGGYVPATGEAFSGTSPVVGRFRISSRRGWRRDPITGKRRYHAGTDYAVPMNTRAVSTVNGTVLSARWERGYGRTVRIRGADGRIYVYAHLNSWAVRPGQRVKRGQVVARTGSSGRSTGPHLHYEVR